MLQPIVVAARDAATRRWAEELVSRLRFAPATRDWEPMGARTLILIRAFRLQLPRSVPAMPAFQDPWVEAYLAANGGDSGPPIVNLLLVWSEDGSDLFEYFEIGTDWCLSAFRWVPDPVHGGTRRAWLPADDL